MKKTIENKTRVVRRLRIALTPRGKPRTAQTRNGAGKIPGPSPIQGPIDNATLKLREPYRNERNRPTLGQHTHLNQNAATAVCRGN